MTPVWGPILGAFVAVVGWLVNEFLGTRRDIRKEIRAEVDKLLESLAILERDAIEFHTSDVMNEGNKVKILRGITRMGRSLPRLSAKGLTQLKPETTMKQLRRSITLENFESAFVTKSSNDEMVSSIMATVGELHDQIEDAYSDRYKLKPATGTLSAVSAFAVILALAAATALALKLILKV